jgi:5-methylcytosine-specific restriction endonuclease McrA
MKRPSYARYLRSDHWQDIRRRVLQRANGFCEGCWQRRATQVHHLTYEHIGAEFLWELVAICAACHARVHDKLPQPRARKEPPSLDSIDRMMTDACAALQRART